MNAISETSNNPRWLASHHINPANIIKVLVLLWLCFFIYSKSMQSQQDDVDSLSYLESPKIDDIYFLDFRVLSDDLRPRENYRIAKVVDITGDVVTFLYSNVFYQRPKSAIDSIHYGLLRYKKYFETKRYDFTFIQLNSMHENQAIYMIKRPENNMLYGNYINDPKVDVRSKIYIPGKRENLEGVSFLASNYLENHLEQAFERFSRSAGQGFAQGQVNLGQLHLNEQYAPQDLDKALYWFKQAALQSNKAGILKYVIVCRQVSYCYENDFYQELSQAGVNIKVRETELKLKTNPT